ncbi:hypothetical protein ABIF38_008642 [Bradyrhizobium japonicum]|uniref:Uncharacterized protein n=1 Tax=Bradyrhizobium elkanii TaxID=29448 RepID=A0ABV4EV33_BRAEL|nr:hypothetical protein [Bradyrhizobium elkanii]
MTSAAMPLEDHQAIASGSRQSASRRHKRSHAHRLFCRVTSARVRRNDISNTLEGAPDRSGPTTARRRGRYRSEHTVPGFYTTIQLGLSRGHGFRTATTSITACCCYPTCCTSAMMEPSAVHKAVSRPGLSNVHSRHPAPAEAWCQCWMVICRVRGSPRTWHSNSLLLKCQICSHRSCLASDNVGHAIRLLAPRRYAERTLALRIDRGRMTRQWLGSRASEMLFARPKRSRAISEAKASQLSMAWGFPYRW